MTEHLVETAAALGRGDEALLVRDISGVELDDMVAEPELIDESLAIHGHSPERGRTPTDQWQLGRAGDHRNDPLTAEV
jgi:hypothetical protein